MCPFNLTVCAHCIKRVYIYTVALFNTQMYYSCLQLVGYLEEVMTVALVPLCWTKW